MPPIITKGIVITDNCCDKTNFYNTFADFPTTGTQNRLYVDKTTFSVYIWDVITEAYISTTPQPAYKVYTALLTQSGTGAPVATVLENTLGGEVVWARGGVGNYTGTLVGAFTLNKTVSNINSNYSAADWEGSLTFRVATLQIGGEDIINLNTAEMIDGAPIALVDDYLNKTQITIKVYP
jgi:hypothetical protein